MAGASVQANEDNARQHKLTTSLKVAYEGEEKETEKNNGDMTWTRKIITMKISNKEILLGLVEEGVITDIKGWSIVLTTDDEAEVTGTWITKKKNTPINISEFFAAYSGPSIESYNAKYNAKKNTESATGTSMALASVIMDIDGVELEVDGTLTTDLSYSADLDAETEEEFIEKATFTDLSGDANDGEGLVTGSIKAGKGKKFTVNFPM